MYYNVNPTSDQSERLFSDALSDTPSTNLFVMKSANEWIEEAKRMPVPKRLFDDFWLEGELCFLYSDTNAGKSVLAVQIAHSISSGIAIPGFDLEAEPDSTVYIDLELNSKQFEARYSSDYKNHFKFDDRFIRVEMDPNGETGFEGDYESYFLSQVESLIKASSAKRLILDNVTFISDETEKASLALHIMKGMKQLKQAYELSILVLGHTPKRSLDQPITQNHLAGSKMLMNFADSAFAIGKSAKESDLRYFKQIKVRSFEERYGADNVITCRLEKRENFLGYTQISASSEREHLEEPPQSDKEQKAAEIRQLHRENPTLSQRDLAEKCECSPATVNRALKQSE